MPTVTYIDSNEKVIIVAVKGTNLLSTLKENGINVYGSLSKNLNCGGNGICATCGVYILSSEVEPKHWHDKLASKYGYPRLSCQITVTKDLTIKKPENKIIWGQLFPKSNRKK